MKKPLIFLVAVLLFCGCRSASVRYPGSPEVARGVSLRYRFAAGQELRYVLRSSLSSQTFGEEPGELSVKHEMEFHQKVLEVAPDGMAKLSTVMDRLKLTMAVPKQETVVFDSDNPKGADRCPPQMRGVAFLVGKEIVFYQTPSGEIVSMTNLAAIYRSALAELPLKERQSLERVLREMSYNPRGLFGVGVVLPRETKRQGESWSAENGPFPILCGQPAYRCAYLVKEVYESGAIVEFKGESGGGQSQEWVQMREVRRADFHGSFRFDLDKGILTAMQGESSSFLRIGEEERLRTKTGWELELKNGSSVEP